MQSAPGFQQFKAFTANINQEDKHIACFDAHIIPDDESLVQGDHIPEEEEGFNQCASSHTSRDEASTLNNRVNTQEIGTLPKADKNQPNLIESFEEFQDILPQRDYEQEESKLDNPTHKLLCRHYKLGHESFSHLQWMAQSGVLPQRLATCRVPQCTACYYGKASQRPWREKGSAYRNKIASATVPGQIVSVDQMQSTVPGLVGQLKGIPTRQRYHYVTVFVEQFSGFSFVHLQKTSSGEETLDAKIAFEGFARSLNVSIQHYHADNGRFCGWPTSRKKVRQSVFVG
jgi:hypothetical protein